MEPKDYIVSRIEGEYAYLKRTDIESEEELFIAMALLPLGVDIGTKLHYECMEYSTVYASNIIYIGIAFFGGRTLFCVNHINGCG
mgnify:CR=1 FL=1